MEDHVEIHGPFSIRCPLLNRGISSGMPNAPARIFICDGTPDCQAHTGLLCGKLAEQRICNAKCHGLKKSLKIFKKYKTVPQPRSSI